MVRSQYFSEAPTFRCRACGQVLDFDTEHVCPFGGGGPGSGGGDPRQDPRNNQRKKGERPLSRLPPAPGGGFNSYGAPNPYGGGNYQPPNPGYGPGAGIYGGGRGGGRPEYDMGGGPWRGPPGGPVGNAPAPNSPGGIGRGGGGYGGFAPPTPQGGIWAGGMEQQGWDRGAPGGMDQQGWDRGGPAYDYGAGRGAGRNEKPVRSQSHDQPADRGNQAMYGANLSRNNSASSVSYPRQDRNDRFPADPRGDPGPGPGPGYGRGGGGPPGVGGGQPPRDWNTNGGGGGYDANYANYDDGMGQAGRGGYDQRYGGGRMRDEPDTYYGGGRGGGPPGGPPGGPQAGPQGGQGWGGNYGAGRGGGSPDPRAGGGSGGRGGGPSSSGRSQDNYEDSVTGMMKDMSVSGPPRKMCGGCKKPIMDESKAFYIEALQQTASAASRVGKRLEQISLTFPTKEKRTANVITTSNSATSAPRGKSTNPFNKPREPIFERPVQALGLMWHEHHLLCAGCDQPIRGNFFEHKDVVYCAQDYARLVAPRCKGCERPIQGETIVALDSAWHKACFVCTSCRRPFPDKSFYVLDGMPYCRMDYHVANNSICGNCKDPIEGPCAEVVEINKRFHPNCWCCALCMEPLSDVYYSYDGEVFCENDIRKEPVAIQAQPSQATLPTASPASPASPATSQPAPVENGKSVLAQHARIQQRSAAVPSPSNPVAQTFPKEVYGYAPVARPSASINAFQAIIVVLLAIMTGVQIQSFMSRGDRLAVAKFLAAQNIIAERNERSPLATSIPVTPSPPQPTPPADAPKQFFTNADLEEYFAVKYIPRTEVDPVIARFVEAHKITNDELYTSDPETAERWRQNLEWYLAAPVKDDERFYIKWVSKEKGYGLYTAYDITKGSVVSICSGVLTNNTASDYVWSYPSEIYDDNGEQIDVGIDARFKGNWARFVNHDENPNSEVIYVMYNNLWHVVYIASEFIPRGQEVLISYGPQYWTARGDTPVGSKAVEEEEEEEEDE
ncbi:hypothetical protein HDU96_008955 [Phlyctochytrium bullatum]|nr:hypothetical protein HDU96_008955 [Phlyctochytrium bullatum]